MHPRPFSIRWVGPGCVASPTRVPRHHYLAMHLGVRTSVNKERPSPKSEIHCRVISTIRSAPFVNIKLSSTTRLWLLRASCTSLWRSSIHAQISAGINLGMASAGTHILACGRSPLVEPCSSATFARKRTSSVCDGGSSTATATLRGASLPVQMLRDSPAARTASSAAANLFLSRSMNPCVDMICSEMHGLSPRALQSPFQILSQPCRHLPTH